MLLFHDIPPALSLDNRVASPKPRALSRFLSLSLLGRHARTFFRSLCHWHTHTPTHELARAPLDCDIRPSFSLPPAPSRRPFRRPYLRRISAQRALSGCVPDSVHQPGGCIACAAACCPLAIGPLRPSSRRLGRVASLRAAIPRPRLRTHKGCCPLSLFFLLFYLSLSLSLSHPLRSPPHPLPVASVVSTPSSPWPNPARTRAMSHGC